MERTPRSVFAAAHHLPDWRITTHQIEADFRAPSWSDAVRLIGLVGAEADRIQHHPDIDLRYPGRVRITLTTHAANGLTDLDASFAASISTYAAQVGAVSASARILRVEIAVDAMNIAAVLPFWRALLGYVDGRPSEPGGIVDEIVDPLRIGPPIWFQQMDAPRTQRNRIHIDLRLPHDVAQQRIADAVAAGGTVVTDQYARAFWVLADPEGNEVCVCTWEDRD
jgi:4a-hydroxytetrahydrobiopterin dehydratase